jgi:hypothetical protein
MRLHARREVGRPVAEVAGFFFDASNNPRWQTGMRRCEWETAPPIGVGSRYTQEVSFLGRRIVSRFEVTEYTPERSITIKSTESTFPITVTRTVNPIDETRCEVAAEIAGSPSGLMAVFAPLTRRLAQRSVNADYDRLASLLG